MEEGPEEVGAASSLPKLVILKRHSTVECVYCPPVPEYHGTTRCLTRELWKGSHHYYHDAERFFISRGTATIVQTRKQTLGGKQLLESSVLFWQ